TAANVLTYSSAGLAADTPYQFRVRAYNGSGDGDYTAAASGRTLLAAPTGVLATPASATQVTVTWNDQSGESGFKVFKSSDNGTTWALFATVGTGVTTADATGLVGGALYKFTVKAINAGGDSAGSAVASATTRPAAPGTLTATPVAPTQIN